MNYEDKITFWSIVLALLLLGVLSLGAIKLSEYSCHKKGELSKFETSWTLFGGCIIKTSTGVWIPEKNYRDTTP
jgi:hypothetical protein